MRLTQKQLDKTLRELNHIVKAYRKRYSSKPERDWRTYEQRLALRMKKAAEEIEPLVEEAYSMISVSKDGRGRPSKIPVTKKVLLLLLKEIFQLSNRKMSNLLMFFTLLTGIDLSYKTVERCYSDELVRLTIHNMFALMVKKKEIDNPDISGDGTGYGLTVTKHYRNEREKELKGRKADRKAFTYAFALMDLDTGVYIGYGTSLKSEMEAFRKALGMANEMGISINSVRLDRLYSCRSITDEFDGGTSIYVIPKKNATIRGSSKWKEIIRNLVSNPFSFLKEYYRRNNSESGFSVDKKLCGWKVWQRRSDRIGTALLCRGVWHNLMLIG
ncbi:MAG TPA: ISNCY family transposase [Candidatus Aenigmarchaeota archaeon]|nr:ISNCY family transposase [Candidatus Aenigmarchaeota archaeon]